MSSKEKAPAAVSTEAPSVERYTQLKRQLTEQILKKQELDAKLLALEDAIYDKENDYFNESTYGSIVKGFENFTKTNTGGSNKKRIVYTDDDHIFSLSSANYVKTLMKRQGLSLLGSKDDLDDYEDSVDPISAKENNGLAAMAKDKETAPPSSAISSNSGTPARKRKARTFDD